MAMNTPGHPQCPHFSSKRTDKAVQREVNSCQCAGAGNKDPGAANQVNQGAVASGHIGRNHDRPEIAATAPHADNDHYQGEDQQRQNQKEWVEHGHLGSRLSRAVGIGNLKAAYRRWDSGGYQNYFSCLSGRRRMMLVPFPSSLSALTVPPWIWRICFTMERPRPVPPELRLRALSTR